MARRVLCSLMVLLLAVPALRACNIPVFRYALERWAPDPFEVFLFHRGPLSPAQKEQADSLNQAISDPKTPLNLRLTLVDLADDPPAALVKRNTATSDDPLPWLVVYHPKTLRIDWPIWSGALSADHVQALVDSPARREIQRRILAGDTAIWVLLTCGDAAKDDRAERTLQTELKRLSQELKLPELSNDPADELRRPDIPFKLEFSILRVQRNDPAEWLLTATLLQSEDDLAERRDPMVFPVFGRGRVLNGLIGAGITADNIQSACKLLLAACSCDLKSLHPGFELLLAADWQTALTSTTSVEGQQVPIPSGPGVAGALPAEAVVVESEDSPLLRFVGYGAGVVFLAAGAAIIWYFVKKQRPGPPSEDS